MGLSISIVELNVFKLDNGVFGYVGKSCRQNCMKGDDFSLVVLKIPSSILLVKSIMRNTFYPAINKLTFSKKSLLKIIDKKYRFVTFTFMINYLQIPI